jgi:catechol 2,3-dioxygenase-like lactoylglutathione lyase family enzyme
VLAPVDFSHLTMYVPDADRADAFYQDAFGLEIQARQGAQLALGVGPNRHFLMFVGTGPGRGRAGGPAQGRIDHACLTVADFSVERVQGVLERFGISPRGATSPRPLQHWVSMRMPNRGGATGGTPELYFSDPDGLSIQLQDPAYCGGGGYLGEVCG